MKIPSFDDMGLILIGADFGEFSSSIVPNSKFKHHFHNAID